MRPRPSRSYRLEYQQRRIVLTNDTRLDGHPDVYRLRPHAVHATHQSWTLGEIHQHDVVVGRGWLLTHDRDRIYGAASRRLDPLQVRGSSPGLCHPRIENIAPGRTAPLNHEATLSEEIQVLFVRLDHGLNGRGNSEGAFPEAQPLLPCGPR